MLLLNELNKFKWTIKYSDLQNGVLTELITGEYFDFIPNKGDIIVLENKIYTVTNKIIDFDKSTILISVQYLKDFNAPDPQNY